jgi:hypothetical protein
MRRVALGLLLMVLAAGTATARPPEIAESPPGDRPTLVEWTTWLRGAIVVARSEAPEPTAARASSPTPERDRDVAGAIGAGFTLPIGSHVRIGPWLEFRSWGLPVVGGELTVLPGSLDMFWYQGKSAITTRAGANPDVLTAQLGVAYRAPWDLFGPAAQNSRYVIGVGVVATATQNRHDPHDWSVTVGVELEPVGALRYLLGVRSWYR